MAVKRDFEDENTKLSALLFETFSYTATRADLIQTPAPRLRVRDAAMHWQAMSANGQLSEMASFDMPNYKHNRVNELAGLMGSIGEQVTMAWTAEQDVQRWGLTKTGRLVEHQRMAVRALAEMSAYFSLGAAHALSNLVLRVIYLNDNAGPIIRKGTRNGKRPDAFAPGSIDKKDWPTFNAELMEALAQGATATQSVPAEKLVGALDVLKNDQRFLRLEERRGMDYHRHRPQSIDTGAPRAGAWVKSKTDSSITVSFGGVHPDPDNDEMEVRAVARDGLEVVATAMNRARPLIGRSVISLGYKLVGC